MSKKNLPVAICLVAAAMILVGYGLQADEFTQTDLDRWQGEFMVVVTEGRSLWGSPDSAPTASPAASATPTPPTPTPRPIRSSRNSWDGWSPSAR